MTNFGNASDPSDEYESSGETISKALLRDLFQLKNALVKLQENFHLLDEPIEALLALT
jgi:hypothetical protein